MTFWPCEVEARMNMRYSVNRQRGVSMVELMVALAVSVLIVLGSMLFLRYMITVADDNRDKTMATLEVQYAGFWISEDVVQSQLIWLGNVSGDPDGFPLTLEWIELDESRMETITYDLEAMEEGDLLRLTRQREAYVKVEGEYELDSSQSGTSLVAKYVVPWSESEGAGTKVCRMEYDTQYDSMKSLILRVAANADGSEASNCYEIYPRVVPQWLPTTLDPEVDQTYAGPECTGDECAQ